MWPLQFTAAVMLKTTVSSILGKRCGLLWFQKCKKPYHYLHTAPSLKCNYFVVNNCFFFFSSLCFHPVNLPRMQVASSKECRGVFLQIRHSHSKGTSVFLCKKVKLTLLLKFDIIILFSLAGLKQAEGEMRISQHHISNQDWMYRQH